MEEAIQYADDLRASNAGTQDLLGTHDTMMLRTAAACSCSRRPPGGAAGGALAVEFGGAVALGASMLLEHGATRGTFGGGPWGV